MAVARPFFPSYRLIILLPACHRPAVRLTANFAFRVMLALLLACLLAAASLFSDAFPAFPPVDQAPQKLDFVGYRSQLLAAIQKKDAVALKPFLAANMEYSYGVEKPGVAGFFKVWEMPSSKSSLWKELSQVVGNGGTFTDANQFVAPYWYSNWPKDRDNLEWEAVSVTGPSSASVRVPF